MSIKLQVQTRVKPEKLAADFFPGIVYSPDFENVLIKIKRNDFIKTYSQAGESNLIDLNIDGKEVQVLVKEIQKHPVKDLFVHVDFYKVDINKEVTAEIPLEFIGESKAVKELGALLVKNIDEVAVECLPKDLVNNINVDISSLLGFGDIIQIKDLILPTGIKVLNNLDDAVVSVMEPKEEKEPVIEEVVPATVSGEKSEGKVDAKVETKGDSVKESNSKEKK